MKKTCIVIILFLTYNFAFSQSLCLVDKDKDTKLSSETLKLTHPNGGEFLVIGSDILVTWEGISPNEHVRLDYSTDNGASWKTIANRVLGLNYNWKNIPHTISNNCRVRVSQVDGTSEPKNFGPQIEWQTTFDRGYTDEGWCIKETSDSGFVISGNIEIWKRYRNQGYYNTDVLVFKLSKTGKLLWYSNFGGSGDDHSYSMIETQDGGYIIVGYTSSDDGYVTQNKGNYDIWILKLNNSGDLLWQKTYGGSKKDIAKSLIETSEGELVIAGHTESKDGDIIKNKGYNDVWILKLNSSGDIIWQKTFGGSWEDRANKIIETNDGGYVIAGFTISKDGDVLERKTGDVWIFKLNSSGVLLWQKSYGGIAEELAADIIETSEGGFAVAAWSNSYDGDISQNIGTYDIWLLKINSTGTLLWEKNFGGSKWDYVSSILESNNGDLILAGRTESDDGDVYLNKGNNDVWLIKVNNKGDILYQKTFGGSSDDVANCLIKTKDGGFALAGTTKSNDGDVTSKRYAEDVWVIKFSEGLVFQNDISDSMFSIVAPQMVIKDINMNQELVGNIKDSLINSFISNTGTYQFRVDSVYFSGTDKDAFKLVSGIPPFNVEKFSNKSVEIRFIPNRIGLHQAKVNIITQSDTLVRNIVGEGIKSSLAFENDIINFGEVYLGNYKDSIKVTTIKNIGNIPIQITNTKHNIPNYIDFSTLSGGGNFILQPDETAKMDLRFKPGDVGRTSGTLEFHYNGIGSPLILNLFGEGVDRKLSVMNEFNDFPALICIGFESKQLKIKNTGQTKLTIKDIKIINDNESNFSIDAIFPFELQSKEEIDLNIAFKAEKPGEKTALLEIISNSFPNSLIEIPLKGKKETVNFESDISTIDYKVLMLDTSGNQSFILTNTGTVKNNYSINLNGNYSINPNYVTLNPKEQIKIEVIYKGSLVNTEFNDKLIIKDELCGIEKQILVMGLVSTSSTEIKVPIIEASPGDEIEIPIILQNQQNLIFSGVTQLSIELGFNPTILSPIDYPIQKIDEKNAKILIDNIAIKTQSEVVLSKIKFRVGLGNAENCQLLLSNAQAVGGVTSIEVINGTFHLLGICYEGGARLLNPNNKVDLLKISPNPNDGNLAVELNLLEKGASTLSVYNSNGELMFEKYLSGSTGKIDLNISTKEFANGLYFVSLQTPTIRKVEQLVVFK